MAKRDNQRTNPSKPAATKPVQTNAGPNPMGSPAKQGSTTFTQGLKIAGTGGVSKQELQKISKTTGRSGSQVVQRLDALNQKLKGKGQMGINLNAGAANMLIKQASKESPTGYEAYKSMIGGQPRFGTGNIGRTLQGMVGKGTTAPSLMTLGTAVRPGGREAVKGFGKQYQFSGLPTSTTMPTTGGTTGGTTGDTELPAELPAVLPPELPPEEEKEEEKDPLMMGIGADLASWATGFRRKGSSRKGAGPRAQGLGSQRVNPTGSFRGGM